MATKISEQANKIEVDDFRELVGDSVAKLSDNEIESYSDKCTDLFNLLFDKWKRERLVLRRVKR